MNYILIADILLKLIQDCFLPSYKLDKRIIQPEL